MGNALPCTVCSKQTQWICQECRKPWCNICAPHRPCPPCRVELKITPEQKCLSCACVLGTTSISQCSICKLWNTCTSCPYVHKTRYSECLTCSHNPISTQIDVKTDTSKDPTVDIQTVTQCHCGKTICSLCPGAKQCNDCKVYHHASRT